MCVLFCLYDLCLLWPWPWLNDLEIHCLPRYSEDVHAYCVSLSKKKFLGQGFQRSEAYRQTDRRTDGCHRIHYQLHSRVVLINTFSPTLFLIVAKMILPKPSVSNWSNPSFLILWHSGTERQSAGMSKNLKGWVRPVWLWMLWSVTIWHHWAWKGLSTASL